MGSSHNCMKLDAKQSELVQLKQKFVPQSHVGIFHNEHNQSTLLDPIPIFGAFYSICMHLGSFRNCMKHGEKLGEQVQLMQKLVPQSHIGIFSNKHTQSTLLDPKLMFRSVS